MRDLMVLVERAVRPVRAGERRKLRMREELLAHVAGIFEEEKARLGDDQAALAEAARRFGDPAELTRELQAAVSSGERAEYYLERWLGWRAPESAARYTLRLSARLFLVNLAVAGLILAVVAAVYGWPADMWLRLRGAAAFMVAAHLDLFLLGWLFFLIRDAVCGAPWAPQSRVRAAGYAAAVGLIVFASGPAFLAAATWDARTAGEMLLPWWAGVAAAAAVVATVSARVGGPAQIRHTVWECLELRA